MSLSNIKSEIADLSYADLQELHELTGKAITDRAEAERKELLTQMDELARAKGFSGLDAVMSSKSDGGSKKPKRSVAPKYRNPQNESETWTGRGRKPKWVVAALEAGGRLEDMLIEPQE